MKEGWEVKKLGEVCKFFRGLTYSKGDEVETSSRKVLRSNNIDLESQTLNLEDMKCLREDFDIEDDKKVKSNSILICMSNGSKQHIGKVAFIEDAIDYAFGGFMGLILPDVSMCAKYIYYVCVSSLFKHFISGIGNGIGITNLRFTDLSSFTLPIPPLPEQQKIVEELDCLSNMIELKKKQLEAYDKLAQSIFYEMFGDPIANDKGWDIQKLENIGTIVTGSTPSTNDISNWDGDINWITPAELGVQLYYGETTRKLTEKGAKGLTLMPKGTVILSTRAPIGKLAITTVPMCCNQGFKNIICGDNINNIYLYYYLMYTMDKIKLLGRGVTFKEVSKSAIADFGVVTPPLTNQQQFAEKIEAIENQKKLVKKSLQEVETLFNSRMDYYFN